MSEKEIAKQIIDTLPDYKVSKILYILKGIQIDDEIEDDIFCEKMVDKYLEEGDHESISFEQALEEAGLTIDELHD